MPTHSKRHAVKRVSPLRDLKASVFTEAARRLVNETPCNGCSPDYACLALSDALGVYRSTDDTLSHRYFEAVLKPEDAHPGGAWYTNGWLDYPCDDQIARSLGLLLCAELVRNGFVPDNWTP